MSAASQATLGTWIRFVTCSIHQRFSSGVFDMMPWALPVSAAVVVLGPNDWLGYPSSGVMRVFESCICRLRRKTQKMHIPIASSTISDPATLPPMTADDGTCDLIAVGLVLSEQAAGISMFGTHLGPLLVEILMLLWEVVMLGLLVLLSRDVLVMLLVVVAFVPVGELLQSGNTFVLDFWYISFPAQSLAHSTLFLYYIYPIYPPDQSLFL